MSIWKKVTGTSWAKSRGIVASIGGAIIGGVIGGFVNPTAWLAGAGLGASIGGAAGSTYAAGDQQRQQAKAMDSAAKEAEAAANAGHQVETSEAAATVDTAGNAAYKKKQAALAAGYGQGRGGTNITSSLGGGGKLG